ncbi:MAG: hypothetical protein P8179_10370 [Candidatus Thiodiazotropha sp.]
MISSLCQRITSLSKQRVSLIVFLVLLTGLRVAYSDMESWLSLESGGVKIFKLYGLPNSQRLTVSLFPVVEIGAEKTLDWFDEAVNSDLPRIGEVINQYQTEVTEIPGFSVISTMRRCQDEFGSRSLVYYQVFYLARQRKLWYVRTELSDNLELLVKYYNDQLSIVLTLIDEESS